MKKVRAKAREEAKIERSHGANMRQGACSRFLALFRKGVLGCCGFNGVEQASLTVVSVPPGAGDVFGVFDAKTQRLTFDDGSVWKLKPCTGPFQTPTERKACEAAL